MPLSPQQEFPYQHSSQLPAHAAQKTSAQKRAIANVPVRSTVLTLPTLSAQLKELQKQCAEQTKANKDKDKAARREAAKQRRAEKLAKIKEILTPEQYIKFLENQYLNAHNKVKGDFRKGRQAFNKERNKMRSDRKVLDKSAKELMKKKESKK